MLTKDILKERPGWELFRDGCPEGESPGDVAARADAFIARVRGIEGDVLAFSSGHIIRMIAARWLGLPPAGREVLLLPPRQRGRARLRAQEPGRADHRPLEPRRPTAGVSRADHGQSVPARGMDDRERARSS